MSIWNKILVALVCLASPFYFYLAARLLKTSENWSLAVKEKTARLEQLAEEEQQLIDGVELPDGTVQPGLRQLRIDLHKLMVDRRRAWLDCVPSIKTDHDDHTAEVSVTINTPDPHGIDEKTVLYAFDEADTDKGGRYLGEFIASKINGKQIGLTPTNRLTERELKKLDASAKAKHRWILYELIPQDNREIFADKTDEELRSLLPASVVEEYIKDGKPAAANDPEDRVVDGKYVRPLRDYGVHFNFAHEYQTFLSDSIEALTRDGKLVDEALALARDQEEACKRDIAAARKERQEMFRQRDIVAAHMKALQEMVAKMQADLEKLIERNRAMAGQIAKFQLEAARRIDRRTRAMARSDSGRP